MDHKKRLAREGGLIAVREDDYLEGPGLADRSSYLAKTGRFASAD